MTHKNKDVIRFKQFIESNKTEDVALLSLNVAIKVFDYIIELESLYSDYLNLKERYVKVLGLNEKVIAEQKAEIERLKAQMTEDNVTLFDTRMELEDCEKSNKSLQTMNFNLSQDNAELQKQVDELKKSQVTYIHIDGQFKKECEYELQQAVKDTTKEIYQELADFVNYETFRKGYELIKVKRKIKEIAKSKGVEVE